MSAQNNLNLSSPQPHRPAIRYFAAALAALMTIIYFLIGFNIVSVIAKPEDQIFGIFAGVAFALGMVLLVATDRRVLWILGAVFQIFVFYTYFSLAPQRVPTYEIWGVLLRVIQIPLLIALAYLALRLPPAQAVRQT